MAVSIIHNGGLTFGSYVTTTGSNSSCEFNIFDTVTGPSGGKGMVTEIRQEAGGMWEMTVRSAEGVAASVSTTPVEAVDENGDVVGITIQTTPAYEFATPVLGASSIVFGSMPELNTLPIVNLPEGTTWVKRRISNKDFMRVFVKAKDGVSIWMVESDPNGLRLVHCQRAQRRETVKSEPLPKLPVIRQYSKIVNPLRPRPDERVRGSL